MTKNSTNLSLLRRTNNRRSVRPPSQSSTDEKTKDGDHDNSDDPSDSRKEKKLSEKRVQRDNGEFFWDNLRGKLFLTSSYRDKDWKLGVSTIFKLLFSLRVTASFWSIISDCDEVYNYWEPLHLLVFGRGLQTWEYSPVYAIRSWFYIQVHNFPAQLLFLLLASSKVAFFHTLRFIIGFASMSSDICLYESVCQRLGNRIGLFFIVFSIFSVGMFNSSCAFLPSSFSMTLNTLAMAAYLREQWFWAILCTCVSALVGWPFAAVLGLPIVLEMLVFRARHLALRFLFFSLAAAAVVLPTLYFVDSFYYGKTVIAPLNIVLYNIFSEHGPDLYGVEPVAYYLKNLFLNWNVLPVLVVLSLPLSLCAYVKMSRAKEQVVSAKSQIEFTTSYWYRYFPVLFIFLATSLWILIFFAQPHKEERFLFPIYPLIAVLAAVALDSVLRLSSKLNFLAILVVSVFILLSVSRGYALHRNFSATLETYKGFHDHFIINQPRMDFSKMQDPIRLCVGKEWHRFQSSFFLPELAIDKTGRKRAVEMRFLQSEFSGLLPKPFSQGEIPKITRRIPSEMNDLNREEPSRYVHLKTCDFLIDLETPEATEKAPNYSAMVLFIHSQKKAKTQQFIWYLQKYEQCEAQTKPQRSTKYSGMSRYSRF